MKLPTPLRAAGLKRCSRITSARSAASRFDAFLENWWPKRPAAQMACALATLVVGLLAGHALTVDVQRSREVARLQEEVGSTRQLVALSMMRQQSASDRLKGVDWSDQIPRPEPQVVNALLETVNYDDAVDVRLAAVDALRRLSTEAARALPHGKRAGPAGFAAGADCVDRRAGR